MASKKNKHAPGQTGALSDQVVWVTGAGSGIGAAVARRMAQLGATVVMTGRRREPLERVHADITKAGGQAWIRQGDLSKASTSKKIAAAIDKKFGRLDILVNNAGINVLKRSWQDLAPESVDAIMSANLNGAFYCSIAVLPIMRRQKNGLLIHTASWAGRFISGLSGPAYTASKHAVVAMSHSINLEEFANGIRSTVVNPGEVATEILDKRPVPVPPADRARMLQAEDLAASIAHVALAPAHVCLNEILISPTWNRLAAAGSAKAKPKARPKAKAKRKTKA
ncbi:MAG: SDR family oxidoreductase [Burkholderiaceae bacterium]